MWLSFRNNLIICFLGLSFLLFSTAHAETEIKIDRPFHEKYLIAAPGINLMPGQQQAVNQKIKKPFNRRSKFDVIVPQSSVSVSQKSLVTNVQAIIRAQKLQAKFSQQHTTALNVLARKSLAHGGLVRKFDKENGTPTLLSGIMSERVSAVKKSKPGLKEQDKRNLVREFLQTNRDLLKLNNPELELKLIHEKKDNVGKRHLFYQQAHNGVPIWGKQAAVHVNQDDQVYLFNGRYRPSLSQFSTEPTVSSENALNVVYAHLAVSSGEVISNELVIFMQDKVTPILVYKIDIKPFISERWLYFIDASTSQVVHRTKNIHNAGSSVNASGADLSNVRQTFNVWQDNNSFYMIDPTFPTAQISVDPLNAPSNIGDTYILDARNKDGSELFYVENNAPDIGWDPVAVSALSNTLTVYDYWLNTHQRKSFDNSNKNLMVAIHLDEGYNNAFWNGTFMVYGDGDNRVFGQLAKCLDIAGHEMSHGVIEHTANLIYENQSGALNESFADVFGAMVDRDDWLIGEDCTIAAPGHLRNMQNPLDGLSSQPTKMSDYRNLPNTPQGDNGGVHVNSGIPNRAAYLVAEGLSIEGLGASIGREKLEKIWYKALRDYLITSSQFIDARRATIQAAKDIYGETAAEVSAVTMAWDIVEITEDGVASPDSSTSTKTDIVTGDDVMVYLFPIDQTHDSNPADRYDVYVQKLSAPDYSYVAANDSLLNKSTYAAYTRPAAYTNEFGTLFFYVSLDGNLWASDGLDSDELVAKTNDIWSIAISPDGRYFAYVSTKLDDKFIHVIDLQADPVSTTSIPLTPPDYQQNGSSTNNSIYYADSIAFDYTGKKLVFDALNCVSIPGNPCTEDGEGGYLYWSLGIANIESSAIFYPFPSQDPLIDLGYPRFASNSNTIIVLDMQDYSDIETLGISSKVLTFDFINQKINTVVDYGLGDFEFWGVPSFWGDDAAVQVQLIDPAVGSIAGRVALDENYVGDLAGIRVTNPTAVAMPIMHRVGQRKLDGALSIDNTNIDLGAVKQGKSVSQSIRIKNLGNRDVAIKQITLQGAAFSHNMTNTVIPRDASLQGVISLQADAAEGVHTGSIELLTDGDPAVIAINLSATVNSEEIVSGDNPVPDNTNSRSQDDGSSSSGCTISANKSVFDPMFLILTLCSLFYVFGRRRKMLEHNLMN